MSRTGFPAIFVFLASLSSCIQPQHADPLIAPSTIDPEDLSPVGGYRGRFNNHDQGHADFCVRLLHPVVALRYADGSPFGFTLSEGTLRPDSAGGGVWCPRPGMARLDAREFVGGADGSRLLFHRGGWGFVGHDPGSAVHFGHLRTTDIDTVGVAYVRADSAAWRAGAPRGRWVSAPTIPWRGPGQDRGNGSACAAPASEPYRVVVKSIPAGMNYLNSRQTGAIPYAIYGSPSTDLGPASDRNRGIRYTILQWSWINMRGGGVARALVKNGELFFPCADVPPIALAAVSDAATKKKTGWVQAVYGAIPTGGGGRLCGWIVSAHRQGKGPVVAHLEK